MDSQELQQALEKLRVEKEKIAKLEEAYALVAAHQSELNPTGSVVAVRSRTRPSPMAKMYGGGDSISKADVIKDALTRVPNQYDLDDVLQNISSEHEGIVVRSDVSFALSRFKKSGKIFMVSQGSGNKPSVYTNEKPQSSTPAHGSGLTQEDLDDL